MLDAGNNARLRDRRRLRRRLGCLPLWWLMQGAHVVLAGAWPRAELAANAQRLAIGVDEVLGVGPAAQLVRAFGGTAAEQNLLRALAHFSAAMDAPARADRQWRRATLLARQRADVSAELATLSNNAQTALGLGDYARALGLAERARALSAALGDRSAVAEAENVTGVIERRRGHLDAALKHQQLALALFKADDNPAGAARVLSDLGTTWRDRGDFTRALDAQLESVAEHERSGDRLDSAYRNVALLYREIEDEPAARRYFQRALAEAARRQNPSAYSTVIGSYASLLNDLGEFGAAHAAAEEALAIDVALGDRPHQGLEHLEIGRALLGAQQRDAAAGHLETALELGRALDQSEIAARALLHLTELALDTHDRLRARGLIDEAIGGLERARLRPQLVQAYALRERLARAEHDDAESLRFAHKHAAAREELIGIRASRQIAALEVRHARADAEYRLALLAKDNELQAERLDGQTVQQRFGAAALAGLLLALAALIWRHLAVRRLNRSLATRNAKIELQREVLGEVNLQLERQAADLYQAASTDWLTGVPNRRHLLERLENDLADSLRARRGLALMVIDFDHFKQINDLHGHLFGDRVLAAAARVMRDCLDEDSLFGRYGGEEFIAVIHERDAEAIVQLADHLREEVAIRLARLLPELRTTATVSIGVAMLDDLETDAPTSSSLIDAADRALYAAKSAGRNRVRRASR